MKLSNKLFVLTVAATLSATSYANVIDMGGTSARLDTVESYQVGPGTVYTKIQMNKGGKIRNVYLLDVDLTNPHVTIESRLAQDRLGVSETMTAMHNRWDKSGHRMIGGINCTPYIMSVHADQDPYNYGGLVGHPAYGVCTNGLPAVSNTAYDRGYEDADHDHESGYLALDVNKRAFVNDFKLVGTVVRDGTTLTFDEFNRPRTWMQEDRITVYNSLIGTTPRMNCREVVFTVNEWKTNGPITCTVTNVNTTGGTALSANMGAIQGINADATSLEPFTAGDIFTLQVNVIARDGSTDTQITQWAGAYSLNMFNGTLTVRNYDEAYSAGDYPRPMAAVNAEGNRVWLMECEKPGITTAEGCYILRSMGAVNAAAFDGGGSAQMMVLGEQKFKTTESTPRALPHAWWVVATCDDSEDAGQLAFVEPLKSIPAYAGYTPQVRAWTKDGLFISHDYKKHTLRCEPTSLGTISADGLTFTANPVDGTGKLIAEYGTAYAETPIEIKDGQIAIRLDSLVLGNTDYKVEVNAVAGSLILPMDAKALAWQSSDESVATINTDGVLHGLHNGTTSVSGSLGGYTDSLKVKVELADAPRLRSDGQEAIGEWAGHKDTVFQIKSVRTGTLTMPLDEVTYGCPDSIILMVNTDSPVASLELAMNVGDSIEEQSYKLAQSLTANTDETVIFAVGKMLNKEDRGIYPIRLNSVKFGFKNPKANKDYNMHIKDIILCYSDWRKVTALPVLPAQLAKPVKIMVNGQVYIIKNNHIYNLKGLKIQ